MKLLITTLTFIFISFGIKAEVNVFALGDKSPNTCTFSIEGKITKETLSEFRKVLKSKRSNYDCSKVESGKEAHTFFDTVVLGTSRGGDLNSAFEIMKEIRRYNLNTFVWEGTKYCNSSCALIFASGTHRHFAPLNKNKNRVLGIHKPQFIEGSYDYVELEKKYDSIKYSLIDFYKKNNVDPRFVIKMFETKFEKLSYEDITNLLIWRVVTSMEVPASWKRHKKY